MTKPKSMSLSILPIRNRALRAYTYKSFIYFIGFLQNFDSISMRYRSFDSVKVFQTRYSHPGVYLWLLLRIEKFCRIRFCNCCASVLNERSSSIMIPRYFAELRIFMLASSLPSSNLVLLSTRTLMIVDFCLLRVIPFSVHQCSIQSAICLTSLALPITTRSSANARI